MNGVDLSHYQDGLNLNLMKTGGYAFAILKISEGRGLADGSFDKFYSAAQAQKIPVGAYVFSHATTPDTAQAEANYALSLLKGRPLQLGIFMDIETTGQFQLPRDQLKTTVQAFMKTINHAGYDFGIYSSEYGAWSKLLPEDFKDSTVWVAHYGKTPAMACDIWQKTDNGSFPGYLGPVDVDEAMSDRFRNKVQPKKEDVISPQDASIAALQLIMNYNGFWGTPTGRYSKEFIDAYFEFGEGMKQVWEGGK